ncbi:MAG: hypothetical protein JW889_14245 [Verrucomicrobia bacterium]|nr:hypothetical protein [Verrucomicrobiota bacterium]
MSNADRPAHEAAHNENDERDLNGSPYPGKGLDEGDEALEQAAEALAEQQEPDTASEADELRGETGEMAEELPAEEAVAFAEPDLDAEPAESAAQEGGLVAAGVLLPATEEIEDTTLSFIQSFNRQLDQIQEMKENLEAETVELKRHIASLERTVAQQTRRIAELDEETKRFAPLEHEIEQLTATVDASRKETEGLRSEIRSRDATIQQKDSFIAELNASHDAMVSKTIDLKEQIQSLREERTRMAAQVEALSAEKQDAANERRRLEQALNQLDAKYQAAHDEVMTARKILGELQSAFETSQRKARTILDKRMGGSGEPKQ